MLRPEIDSANMRLLVREMKNLNPELRKAFVDGLKKDLQPMANELAEMVPKQPPLSGMAHKGRTGWNSSIKGTAYITPSGRKSLARIEVFGRGAQKAALKIADLAGTKMTYVKGRQGLNFINKSGILLESLFREVKHLRAHTHKARPYETPTPIFP